MSYIANAVTYAPAPSGDTTGATDTTNLQAALNALPSGGGTVRLSAGTYYITAISTVVPTTIIGQGAGGIGDLNTGGTDTKQVYAGATTINCVSATATAITIGVPTFTAQGFHLVNTASTTPTAGAGIAAVAAYSGDYARFLDLSVGGFYINIDLQNAEGPYFSRVCNYSPVQYGLHLANATIPDGGGVAIDECQFLTGISGSTAAAFIRWESGGGLRMSNSGCTGGGANPATALDIACADGVNTSVFLLSTNTFENVTAYGVRVHLGGPSNTGRLSRMAFTGNEFAGGTTKAISISPEASGKVSNIALDGNVFGSDIGTAYDLTNVDHVSIGTSDSMATTYVAVGAGVTNLTQSGTTIAASGQAALSGAVVLAAGPNVTLTESGQTITIATGGGTGVPYAPLTNQNTPDLIYTSAGDVIATPA